MGEKPYQPYVYITVFFFEGIHNHFFKKKIHNQFLLFLFLLAISFYLIIYDVNYFAINTMLLRFYSYQVIYFMLMNQ